jgi:hypothetical protein
LCNYRALSFQASTKQANEINAAPVKMPHVPSSRVGVGFGTRAKHDCSAGAARLRYPGDGPSLAVANRGCIFAPGACGTLSQPARRLGVGVNQRRETESETQRTGAGRRGTDVDLAGQRRRDQNGETDGEANFCKDYVHGQGVTVNKRAGKSLEGKGLAPRVGLKPTTFRLTARKRGLCRIARQCA